MSTCTRCGERLSASARFCAHCGQSLTAGRTPAQLGRRLAAITEEAKELVATLARGGGNGTALHRQADMPALQALIGGRLTEQTLRLLLLSLFGPAAARAFDSPSSADLLHTLRTDRGPTITWHMIATAERLGRQLLHSTTDRPAVDRAVPAAASLGASVALLALLVAALLASLAFVVHVM